MAKEAAGGQSRDAPDQVRWQASLPHLSKGITERRSGATSQWIRNHVRPERRCSPWRPRFPEEGNAEGAQVHCPALLSAAIRPRGDRLVFARPDDRPPADGFGRVLVVQLWEETVTTSLVYGVSGVGPPDQGAVAESGKGLRVGAPKGANAEMAVKG